MASVEIQIQQTKVQISERIKALRKGTFARGASPKFSKNVAKFGEKRELKGHFQKVYAIDWAGQGSDMFLSASQDGKLITWDAESTQKRNAITLADNWVMTCCFERQTNSLMASGGLKNICYVYEERPYQAGVDNNRPVAELEGHEGYISGSCFAGGKEKIVTSSGDGTCRLWDIAKSTTTHMFKGHTQDVMSVSAHPHQGSNIFVTGSIDLTCMLWDVRQPGNVGVFSAAANANANGGRSTKNMFSWDDEPEFAGNYVSTREEMTGHESDVNSVAFFPDGNAFASGSDDTTCRLWDLRSHQSVNVFRNSQIVHPVNSIDFSASGRILFAGYDDTVALGWDVLKPTPEGQDSEFVLGERAHEEKISALKVHSAGKAVATGSWDTLIKIYA